MTLQIQAPTSVHLSPNERQHRALHNAVTTGDWDSARRYLEQHRDALSTLLSFAGAALHVAILSKEFDIAKELVNMMSEKELEIQNKAGYTALHLVAMVKSKSLARMMLEKNRNLTTFRGPSSKLPVIVAADQDNNYDMTLHLYKYTPLDIWDPDKRDCLGVHFVRTCIYSGYLDIALDLVKKFPKLALSKTSSQGGTILGPLTHTPSYFKSGSRFALWQQWIYSSIHVPSSVASPNLHEGISTVQQRDNSANACNGYCGAFWNRLKLFGGDDIYCTKIRHVRAQEILDVISKEISTLTLEEFSDLNGFSYLASATRNGIIEIFEAIIKAHPDILIRGDPEGNCPFAHAVIHRQEKILGLIHQFGGYKHWVSTFSDRKGNTLLHKAGELALVYQLERVSGAALQFQREIQWFKEVEKIIPTSYRLKVNQEGKYAHQLFVEKHRELKKEGEKWLKEFATSSTIVAALITTIMFAAIYTLPGGNNENTGNPIFAHRNSFIVFVVSDALSLFFSTTSLIIFLGILTSRFAEEDFLELLPRKLILGLSSLFLSLVSMIVAFGCTLGIILRHQIPWVFAPIILISSAPIAAFVLLHFPLLVQIFNSTYGPSIFERPKMCKH